MALRRSTNWCSNWSRAKPGACPANSRGEQLLKPLTGPAVVSSYTIQDGNLQIVLPDGSTLVFAPVK